MQGIYLGYMYSRWRKIRGLDKDDPIENKGQMQSSFKQFEKRLKRIKNENLSVLSGSIWEMDSISN